MEGGADWSQRYLGELLTQRQLSPHTIAAYRRDLAELAQLAGHPHSCGGSSAD
ncbi:MAG TPA: hypothetical protein DDZ22_07615, partial [Massilia sp.]|nr:hypothetical protein [Massilia sp.]